MKKKQCKKWDYHKRLLSLKKNAMSLNKNTSDFVFYPFMIHLWWWLKYETEKTAKISVTIYEYKHIKIYTSQKCLEMKLCIN